MGNTEPKQLFRKPERLCSHNLITKLFEKGNSFYSAPIKVFYPNTTSPQTATIQLLISVPKKNLKHAVDRNRIKRLMREAYRKNKHLATQPFEANNRQCLIALIFTAKSVVSYTIIEEAIKIILNRLVSEYEQGSW